MSLNRMFFKRKRDQLVLQELQSMSDHSLDDIGLSRMQVLYPAPRRSLRRWLSRRAESGATGKPMDSQA
ncbi:DUF1127 domain-containing protein [Pararhizobium arenae]|uniref:DUF1127 domain-containing protein n=1 Tax=Pararhizobium arenae TaxID=1856850 RepID=UPI00094AC1D5|nr:DUF1127 domain-containing protein [Pararhizobium arenae]